jgi:hypothetical protein
LVREGGRVRGARAHHRRAAKRAPLRARTCTHARGAPTPPGERVYEVFSARASARAPCAPSAADAGAGALALALALPPHCAPRRPSTPARPVSDPYACPPPIAGERPAGRRDDRHAKPASCDEGGKKNRKKKSGRSLLSLLLLERRKIDARAPRRAHKARHAPMRSGVGAPGGQRKAARGRKNAAPPPPALGESAALSSPLSPRLLSPPFHTLTVSRHR